MFKLSGTRILLFSILVFAFGYRLLLMHWATYPPGADIGLHNSVIHSIVGSGNVNFLWNNYQMGGESSLTFPGYHIFVSSVILLTGLPDFVAHSIIVSLFSTLIVAIAFLMTRRLWGLSTAFIVTFLVAVSRFDIEILLWGGYPNVITLALIPLTFYLYLQKERFSLFPFLFVTTLLTAAIYLTHSLSAFVFLSLACVFVVLGILLSRKIGIEIRQLGLFVLPILLGALIVSPFLIQAIPAYLRASSGTVDIQQALLSTRVLPAEIVIPLFACVILFFLFSKEYEGRFLTVTSLLLTLWILVPSVFTQGYLIGQYVDYNRFLYFVLFPLLILIAMVVDHSSRLLSHISHAYISTPREKLQPWKGVDEFETRLKPHLTRKNIYAVFLLALLLFLFFQVQLLVTPWEGERVQSFYQVMTNPGYDAIQWVRTNTPVGSKFTSDALYGWWLGGFAQRPTLSAVDPQYLANSDEAEPAAIARNLLDSDYVIDNGLIQVREDGGYVDRHNPMFLGKLNWTYFPYPYFNFDNGDTTIRLSYGGDVKFFDLTQLSVLDMKLENDSNHAEISVLKGNALFNLTQTLTVYRNRQFVNMSITIDSALDNVSLLSFDSILHIRGELINKTDTVGLFELGSKVLGQIIYTENYPEDVNLITPENPSGLEFVYNLHGGSSAELQLFLSVFSVSDSAKNYENILAWENPYLNGLLDKNAGSYLEPVPNLSEDLQFDVFDYKKALADWNISYVACRDFAVFPKFANDPTFSRVFINEEVSVFKVKSILS
jgi:hypothetical protein